MAENDRKFGEKNIENGWVLGHFYELKNQDKRGGLKISFPNTLTRINPGSRGRTYYLINEVKTRRRNANRLELILDFRQFS